jgi:flavodoxin short chain
MCYDIHKLGIPNLRRFIMKNSVIVFWSATGNTEAIANELEDALISEGSTVKKLFVDDATLEDLENADIIALGCPAMGAEILEDGSMEPFVESLSNFNFSNKKVALFGSYDWGDGQWMKDWEERMESYGATLVSEGLIVHLHPEDEDIQKCKEMAHKLAN